RWVRPGRRLGLGDDLPDRPGDQLTRIRTAQSQWKVRIASATAMTDQTSSTIQADASVVPEAPNAPPRADPTAAGGSQAATVERGAGRSATGTSTPPMTITMRNRTLARTRVASARSEPAIASPNPANVAVPSTMATASAGSDTAASGRQPRAPR